MKRKRKLKPGALGEKLAVSFLKNKGYKIIGKNFRSKFGEIDLIAIEKEALVFVEVKARWSLKFGSPAQAINQIKIDKIKKTARYFKLLNPKTPDKMRVDAVLIDFTKKDFSPKIQLVRNITL